MKDNARINDTLTHIISSDALRLAMRPTMRRMLTLRVANDNCNLEKTAVRQVGFLAFCVVLTIAVVLAA